MSTGPTVTEREAYTAAQMRGAFFQGAAFRQSPQTAADIDAEAMRRWPNPRVTRPREVIDPSGSDCVFKCAGGSIEWDRYTTAGGWKSLGTVFTPTPQRIRLWADLLNSPTETV